MTRQTKKRSTAKKMTDIPGLGTKTMEKLKDAGIKTVLQLSRAKPDKLSEKVDGISEEGAATFIAAAQELVPSGKKTKAKKKKRKKKSTKKTKKKTVAKLKKPKKKSDRMKAVTKKKPVKRRAKKEIEQADVIKDLALELESLDEQVVLGALDRMALIDDPKATTHITKYLTDKRQMVRIVAAAQLGERQDKKAIPALIDALSDKSLFVRQTVAGALENIGGKKALKAVKKAEKDGLLPELPEGRRLIDEE